jgi:hypothetical protein
MQASKRRLAWLRPPGCAAYSYAQAAGSGVMQHSQQAREAAFANKEQQVAF